MCNYIYEDSMMEKKKNKFIRYYEKHYADVVDYCISVHQKFGKHNTFLFLAYGLILCTVDFEYKRLVCELCFAISTVSFITFLAMKAYFPKYKKYTIVFANGYLISFLVLLTLLYFYHPSHLAYTILICSLVTTAMTNMMPQQYISIILGACAFDLMIYFSLKPLGGIVEIAGYVLNDILIIMFTVGINCLYSKMKFKEFEQKHFWKVESYHDSLTKIYNRRFVEHYAAMNLKSSEICAMFLIDLDNFKKVNDTFGHEKGDEILCKVSSILKSNFRKTDCVARIGGDEFAILMPTVTDKSYIIARVKKILGEFPMVLKKEEAPETEVKVSLSVGIIFTKPGQEIEYEDLYRRADKLMYKAKKNGKACAVVEIKGGKEEVIYG